MLVNVTRRSTGATKNLVRIVMTLKRALTNRYDKYPNSCIRSRWFYNFGPSEGLIGEGGVT